MAKWFDGQMAGISDIQKFCKKLVKLTVRRSSIKQPACRQAGSTIKQFKNKRG
jgi:hypothetical protein